MKRIEEIIGTKATKRLKESYGELVDWIGVEEESPQIFKMRFQISDWKKTICGMRTEPTNGDKERVIGVGVAEIEQTLYRVLDFGSRSGKYEIHLDNGLPRNGIHMHRGVYAELMASERDAMRRIEEHLERVGEGRVAR